MYLENSYVPAYVELIDKISGEYGITWNQKQKIELFAKFLARNAIQCRPPCTDLFSWDSFLRDQAMLRVATI